MFLLSLVFGGVLGVCWWFRFIPDPLIYGLSLVVVGMAFSSWQRKHLFKRADAKCEDCGADWNEGYMLEAHHIKPLNEGGADHTDNGVMVCIPCHADRHDDLAYEAKKRGDRRSHDANAYSARQIRKRSIWRRGFSAREKQLSLFE